MSRDPKAEAESRARAATDLVLVERAREGDQRAFRQLVEGYQRKVYTIAFGILRSQDEALDVVQDAFVKVHRHLPSFQGNSSFYTWLYRIVVNLCIDRKRRAARAAEVEYDDGIARDADAPTSGPTLASVHMESPRQAYERRQLREQMGEALEALSDAHREILVLREVEGLSYEELAETLGIAKGTVMSRLFHARKNFQKAFRQQLAA